MPTAETTQPTMTTGRRPRVSATRPPGSSAAPVITGNREEADPRPDRRTVQDLVDEQRHQGAAHAKGGESVGQVGRRGGPPGAVPNGGGQRRQAGGRRAPA